jgi:hypothetical protein
MIGRVDPGAGTAPSVIVAGMMQSIELLGIAIP